MSKFKIVSFVFQHAKTNHAVIIALDVPTTQLKAGHKKAQAKVLELTGSNQYYCRGWSDDSGLPGHIRESQRGGTERFALQFDKANSVVTDCFIIEDGKCFTVSFPSGVAVLTEVDMPDNLV